MRVSHARWHLCVLKLHCTPTEKTSRVSLSFGFTSFWTWHNIVGSQNAGFVWCLKTESYYYITLYVLLDSFRSVGHLSLIRLLTVHLPFGLAF